MSCGVFLFIMVFMSGLISFFASNGNFTLKDALIIYTLTFFLAGCWSFAWLIDEIWSLFLSRKLIKERFSLIKPKTWSWLLVSLVLLLIAIAVGALFPAPYKFSFICIFLGASVIVFTYVIAYMRYDMYINKRKPKYAFWYKYSGECELMPQTEKAEEINTDVQIDLSNRLDDCREVNFD